MTSYISQATKRAEYNHAFGRGGEKIREGMYNAIVHEMGGVELAKKAAARLKVMRARIKALPPDAIGVIISEEEILNILPRIIDHKEVIRFQSVYTSLIRS
jgi:hypothetical protein